MNCHRSCHPLMQLVLRNWDLLSSAGQFRVVLLLSALRQHFLLVFQNYQKMTKTKSMKICLRRRCRSTGSTGISKEELDRLKITKKRDRFQHEWLFRKERSFCSQTGIWCLVYVEIEGMYCLLP